MATAPHSKPVTAMREADTVRRVDARLTRILGGRSRPESGSATRGATRRVPGNAAAEAPITSPQYAASVRTPSKIFSGFTMNQSSSTWL
jgi:hypothetical protein